MILISLIWTILYCYFEIYLSNSIFKNTQIGKVLFFSKLANYLHYWDIFYWTFETFYLFFSYILGAYYSVRLRPNNEKKVVFLLHAPYLLIKKREIKEKLLFFYFFAIVTLIWVRVTGGGWG